MSTHIFMLVNVWSDKCVNSTQNSIIFTISVKKWILLINYVLYVFIKTTYDELVLNFGAFLKSYNYYIHIKLKISQ